MTFNIDEATKQRFWSKVDIRSDSECWNWTGSFSKSGNSGAGGWSPGKSGLSDKTHRAVWQMTYGEVPEGKRIKRTCGNLRCCNPKHLTLSSELEERFWSKVDKTPGLGKGDCWFWTGEVKQSGYGQFRPDPKKPHTPAHRVAWELANNSKIPEGKVILHLCDQRCCVNPSHLQPGTAFENVHDMISKGRSNFIPPPPLPKGEKHPNASVTEEQVRDIKRMFSEGATYQQVIDKHKVSKGTAYNIKVGKYWGHVK
jgi:HNH endonuclease